MILVQLTVKILRLAILASLHLPVIFELNVKMINTFKTFRNINTVEHQFYVPGFYVPIDLVYQFKIPCMREVDLMLENFIDFMYQFFLVPKST